MLFLSIVVDMSRFTGLTTLELRFDGQMEDQIMGLRHICASLSSYSLEELHFSFLGGASSIAALHASLGGLCVLDTIFSGPQFSRLTDVTFQFDCFLLIEEDYTISSYLMGMSADSEADETLIFSELLRDVDIPSYAFVTDEAGECWLTSSYLAGFLQQRVEGQLRQLRNRDVLTSDVSVEIGRPNDTIWLDASTEYHTQSNERERRRKRNEVRNACRVFYISQV